MYQKISKMIMWEFALMQAIIMCILMMNLILIFFKDRIFAVHLHDNDKSDNLHLLPFDGTIDWKYVISKLKECNYNGPITMELCYRYDYLKIPLDEFYKVGYERGLQLLNVVEKEDNNQKEIMEEIIDIHKFKQYLK